MVRKLGELTKLLVFNSGTKSFENSSIFAFYLLLFAFIQNFIFALLAFDRGLVTMLCLRSDGAKRLPSLYLTEDGRLCSMGLHCPGFPRMLSDALICLGYDGDAPIYHCRLSRVHDLDRREVSVMIPLDPAHPWSWSIIGSEPDTSVEMMAHIALTSLCKDRLAATAALPIALLPIRNQENPVWQQCLEAMSNLEGPHFHVGMTSLARYAQYLFNLQHNTARIVMQQHMCLMTYEEHTTATLHELERLRNENAILCSGVCPPSEQDRKLQVAYHDLVRLSMGGTTPVCCSTSVMRRWILVPTGSSTLRTTWRRRTLILRRGWKRSPTSSNSFCSCRGRHHLHPLTTRR
jgi:hypothetical protein